MFGFKQRAIVQGNTGDPPPPKGNPGGVAGWQGVTGYPNPSQQIGRYAGQMLTQFPVNLPGVQLRNGVSELRSGWYTPSKTYTPGNQDIYRTTRPNNVNPGQRYGSQYSGPLGPISVRKMFANISAAQVRQSGLAATQWAQGLSNNN